MRIVSLRADQQRSFGPVRVAESGWERTRGLLGHAAPQAGEGMLILRCASVHTLGMRYRIDVLFLDAQGFIRQVRQALAPARLAWCGAASHTLEMAAGQSDALGLRPGMRLSGW